MKKKTELKPLLMIFYILSFVFIAYGIYMACYSASYAGAYVSGGAVGIEYKIQYIVSNCFIYIGIGLVSLIGTVILHKICRKIAIASLNVSEETDAIAAAKADAIAQAKADSKTESKIEADADVTPKSDENITPAPMTKAEAEAAAKAAAWDAWSSDDTYGNFEQEPEPAPVQTEEPVVTEEPIHSCEPASLPDAACEEPSSDPTEMPVEELPEDVSKNNDENNEASFVSLGEDFIDLLFDDKDKEDAKLEEASESDETLESDEILEPADEESDRH